MYVRFSPGLHWGRTPNPCWPHTAQVASPTRVIRCTSPHEETTTTASQREFSGPRDSASFPHTQRQSLGRLTSNRVRVRRRVVKVTGPSRRANTGPPRRVPVSDGLTLYGMSHGDYRFCLRVLRAFLTGMMKMKIDGEVVGSIEGVPIKRYPSWVTQKKFRTHLGIKPIRPRKEFKLKHKFAAIPKYRRLGYLIAMSKKCVSSTLSYRSRRIGSPLPLKPDETCYVCEAKATLRHHVIQVINGGRSKLNNLVPLCRDCHKKIHPHLNRV